MKNLFAALVAGLFALPAVAQTYPAPKFSSLILQNPLTPANGGTGATTSTGTGSVVLSNSPSLTTPALGVPSSVTLTNGTGLPVSTGVSGLGTGVATALGNAVTGSGSPVLATSPSIASPTITGALNATGLVTLADHATQAANTIIGNGTGSTASPTALSVPSCSATSSALNWTSGTGFTCVTGYAPLASPQFTGAGTTFTTNNSSNPTDGPSTYFIRNATYTGGTPGNVDNTVKVIDNVSSGATTYEWAFLSQINNSATAGQNVAIYGQGNKLSTGPTWGGVFDAQDHTGTANPTAGLIGTEIDLTGNGADNNNARIGIDLVGFNYNSGTTPVFGIGMRMGPYSGLSTNGSFSTGFQFNGGYGNVLDTSNATITGSALRMAAGQTIGLDAASTNTLSYVAGTGLAYKVSGASAFTVSTAGAASVASLSANGGLAAGTTLNVTGLSTLTGGIAGSTTGGAPATGTVGEIIKNNASGVSLTTATTAVVTSVSLTAGDWDCQGTVQYNPAATTTYTTTIQGISTNTAFGAVGNYTNFQGGSGALSTGNPTVWVTPTVNVNISTTTTYNLIAQSNFATSTMTAAGFLRCLRIH